MDSDVTMARRALVALTRGTLLVLLASTATPAQAEPRISLLEPVPGGWRVAVEGVEAPVFLVDGVEVDASRDDPDAGPWRLPMRATADSPARLVVRDDGKEVLALGLVPDARADAPYNEWSIHHIMLAYFRNGSADNDRYGMRRWEMPAFSTSWAATTTTDEAPAAAAR